MCAVAEIINHFPAAEKWEGGVKNAEHLNTPLINTLMIYQGSAQQWSDFSIDKRGRMFTNSVGTAVSCTVSTTARNITQCVPILPSNHISFVDCFYVFEVDHGDEPYGWSAARHSA